MQASGDLLDLKRRFLAQAHGYFQLAGVAFSTQSQIRLVPAQPANVNVTPFLRINGSTTKGTPRPR
jgi:hypothetical protein